MKPIPDCPARAILVGEHAEPLTISDLSVGGMALVTTGALNAAQISQRLVLRLSLDRYGEHVLTAEVRYVVGGGLTGVQFVDLSSEATKAVRRYVAELLERGAPS